MKGYRIRDGYLLAGLDATDFRTLQLEEFFGLKKPFSELPAQMQELLLLLSEDAYLIRSLGLRIDAWRRGADIYQMDWGDGGQDTRSLLSASRRKHEYKAIEEGPIRTLTLPPDRLDPLMSIRLTGGEGDWMRDVIIEEYRPREQKRAYTWEEDCKLAETEIPEMIGRHLFRVGVTLSVQDSISGHIG